MTHPGSGRRWLLLAIAGAAFLWQEVRSAVPEWERRWVSDVQPLLDKHCFKCHGGVRQRGGLDIRSLETMMRGGENGPAVVPGNPAKSHVHQFVHPGAETQMPPEGRPQLSRKEIESLRAWIQCLPAWTPPGTNSIQQASQYSAWLAARRKPIWKPRAGVTVQEAIDGFMNRGWREWGVRPVPAATDEVYARRLFLDLAGRIPSRDELQVFLQAPAKVRREQLVDRLLSGEEYPRRMRDVFDAALLGRGTAGQQLDRQKNHWHDYLERSFRENRPWNEIVHSLIISRPENEKDLGAGWYLYERKNDHQAAAEALGPLAFGMRIDCAQCHNHPLAWEVEQRHYWGLVAALKRSKNVETEKGPAVAESAIGGFISFMNLRKETQPALLIFPNGREIMENRPADDVKEQDLPALYRVPPPPEKQKVMTASVPLKSRRAELADALSQENPLLARAFVNRVWALLHGRGLIHPVDEMDSRNRSNHPELLDWLARDFAERRFDIKRLVRGIVLSRPYQLESRTVAGRTLPPPESFARALDRPLTAEQIHSSLRVLAGRGNVALDEKESKLRRTLVERFPEVFPVEYNATLQQAMFLSNSPLVEDALTGIVGALEIKEPRRAAQVLFRAVLGRDPDATEARQSTEFLAKRNSSNGLRQLAWALVASPEFMLNH